LQNGGASHLFSVTISPAEPEQSAKEVRKMECKYEGKIRFTTDKELTERELQQLIFAIEVQIEEPTDSNGDDEEFTTSTVLVELGVK
jgi:uncharacterized protein YggL (DUF469 family)